MAEAERVKAYLETINRIEPDVAPLDQDGVLTSIAISLRNISLTLDAICKHMHMHGIDQ